MVLYMCTYGVLYCAAHLGMVMRLLSDGPAGAKFGQKVPFCANSRFLPISPDYRVKWNHRWIFCKFGSSCITTFSRTAVPHPSAGDVQYSMFRLHDSSDLAWVQMVPSAFVRWVLVVTPRWVYTVCLPSQLEKAQWSVDGLGNMIGTHRNQAKVSDFHI